MLTPAQTPKDIVLRLQRECLKALQSPSINPRFASESAVIGGEPSDQFAAFIAHEQRRWKDMVVRRISSRGKRLTPERIGRFGAELDATPPASRYRLMLVECWRLPGLCRHHVFELRHGMPNVHIAHIQRRKTKTQNVGGTVVANHAAGN